MFHGKRYLGLLTALFVLLALPVAAQAQSTSSDTQKAERLNLYAWERFTAESWVKNTAYAITIRIVNGSNVYEVITAGTTENTDSAGPKGTAQDITDGTAHWKWIGTTTALGIDNTSTAGEAALATPVITTANWDSMVVVASAVGTSSDRVLTVACYAVDGTTVLWTYPTVAVGAAAKVLVEIRGDMAVPGTAPTGVTYWNTTPCPRMKASMAAISAGAGITASLAVYGRRLPDYLSKPVKFQYESGSVASGAALSKTVTTAGYESIQVIVEATTTNRALVVSCLDQWGKSVFDFASLTVTAGSKFLRTFRFDSPIPGTEATNVVHLPVDLCPSMKASIAAAGAASAKLAMYAR